MLHDPGAPYELEQDTLEDTATVALNAPRGPRAWLEDVRAHGTWRVPLMLFFGAMLVFSLTSFDRVTKPSRDTHFVYLAETYNAMISGLWNPEVQARRADKVAFELERKPPHRNDWASYYDLTLKDGERVQGVWLGKQGRGKFKRLDKKVMVLEPQAIDHKKTKRRYFVSFPPGPAWVMMPLVAVFGTSVNDVLFTIFFASLNVALLFLVLETLSRGGRSGRSRRDNLWLTLLMGFGTSHFWLAVMGQVWFTALIVGVTFTLAYILFSIDARHPFLAGCACALAFSTRTPLLFASLFFFLFVLFPGGVRLRRDQWGWAFKKLVWFCLPCLVVGISLLVMNKIRFGSATEFGHSLLAAGQIPRIKKWGLFHPVFLSKNLTAMLTLLPRFTWQYPYVLISKHGMSLFLTTPAFFYLFRPKPREGRADVFWYRALWATVIVCAVPGLFYQNTGYEQYGFRFALDYTPYLILLLAVGRHPITRAFKASILFGVLVNLFGALTLKRVRGMYLEKFFV